MKQVQTKLNKHSWLKYLSSVSKWNSHQTCCPDFVLQKLYELSPWDTIYKVVIYNWIPKHVKKFTCSLWKQETFSKEDDHGPYMTAGISILSLLGFRHSNCVCWAEELDNRKRKVTFHFKNVMPSTCFNNPHSYELSIQLGLINHWRRLSGSFTALVEISESSLQVCFSCH